MNVNNIRRNKTNINKLDKLIVNVYCKLRKWLTLPENELGNVRLIRTKNYFGFLIPIKYDFYYLVLFVLIYFSEKLFF